MKTSQVLKWFLSEKWQYSVLFWSLFSCIRTEYGELLRRNIELYTTIEPGTIAEINKINI